MLPSILVFSALSAVSAVNAPFDVLIRNGRVVDGTGNPATFADVGVRDGRIAAVGKLHGAQAKTVIDAKGSYVAPGFIDVHTHAEDINEQARAENFARMGVTSIVTGNCGGSRLNVAEFFEQIDGKVSINVATLIGHNSVRRSAMGGEFNRPPADAELATMKSLVEQAMKDGAVGLSTGLIYRPGTWATTEEMIELAKVAAAHEGLYASHMRNEGVNILDALSELFRIAREAGLRADVSHLKLSGKSAWGRADEIIAALEQARAEGLDITHDQYVYTASSTSLNTLIPNNAFDGGQAEFVRRLDEPAEKAKIIAGMKENLRRQGRDFYQHAVIASYSRDRSLNGKNVVEAARLKRGSDSLDDQIELILDIARSGGASAVFHNMHEDDLQRFLQHPNTMIASDSGVRRFGEGVPHPRGYGNNARVLGRYVRDLNLLRLEDAIRKMTSLPATTYRLKDRGLIREGAWADLVVFDLEKVSDPATFNDPHHYAVGFKSVLVNGVEVVRDDAHTDGRPGRALRHSR